jgi:hypothetical protein
MSGLSGTEGCWFGYRKDAATDSAESLGIKAGQQRHRDKDKCRRRYRKISRFGCHITKNIARSHGHSPRSRRTSRSTLPTDEKAVGNDFSGLAGWLALKTVPQMPHEFVSARKLFTARHAQSPGTSGESRPAAKSKIHMYQILSSWRRERNWDPTFSNPAAACD